MDEYIDKDVLLQKLSRMIDYCKTDNKVSGLTALFQVGDAIRKIESGRVYVKYKQLDKYGSPILPEREVTEQAFSHCGMRRIK